MTRVLPSPNRERLLRTARRLAPLLPELVFVGGQMVELLVTDPAGVRVRPTVDVDVVVRTTTRNAYRVLQQRLAQLGFTPDGRDGAPVCRMRTVDDLILDVMPLDEQVLGFTNRWYDLALRTAHPIVLGSDCTISGIAAPVFLATKWQAFSTRGVEDPMTSHDLEDIITLVAGRVELPNEVTAMDGAARRFIAEATKGFLGTSGADDVVSGCLPDAPLIPGYVDLVIERLRSLSGL